MGTSSPPSVSTKVPSVTPCCPGFSVKVKRAGIGANCGGFSAEVKVARHEPGNAVLASLVCALIIVLCGARAATKTKARRILLLFISWFSLLVLKKGTMRWASVQVIQEG